MARNAQAVTEQIESALGAPARVFRLPGGAAINVDAAVLSGHIDPRRAEYSGFLPETLDDPFEVWLAFERHRGSGQVVLRYRVIKAVRTRGREGLLLVAQAVRGQMEA